MPRRSSPPPEIPGKAYAKAKKLAIGKVAEMVGVSDDTIRRRVERGEFPAGVEVFPGVFRWTEPVVLAYIAESEKGPRTRSPSSSLAFGPLKEKSQ